MNLAAHPIGDHLRAWRQRRRMSQLDLACEADISPRHLSFVETGRARPSREMILRLAEPLDVPLRERNVLLVAAGFAPVFPERSLSDPKLKAAREAIEIVINGHRPYPAFALDRRWNVVASNGALPMIYDGVRADLLEAPINVMRLSLHPEGLARRIVNLGEWSDHLMARLARQIDLTADPVLLELKGELERYRGGQRRGAQHGDEAVVPFRLRLGDTVLNFFTTTMVFGAPADMTLSELALESFFPADPETAATVRALETP